LADIEYINLGSQSNDLNFPNPYKVLGNHYSDNDVFVDVYGDECPSAPTNLLVSKEYFDLKDLYLESNSVKEDILMESFSSVHYPLWPTIFNALTCEEDTPCSSSSSSNELNFGLTQCSEVIHHE